MKLKFVQQQPGTPVNGILYQEELLVLNLFIGNYLAKLCKQRNPFCIIMTQSLGLEKNLDLFYSH